jgi:hypothetical protein
LVAVPVAFRLFFVDDSEGKRMAESEWERREEKRLKVGMRS